MLTPEQQQFLSSTAQAAQAGGHVWPAMGACEAAVESGWGESQLDKEANNLFGCKQHQHPVYGTVNIPTREFTSAGWVTEDAEWVSYPTVADCFADRMLTLRTLSSTYPNYGLALVSDTPEEYVTEVSRSWSTDPNRAQTCIEIFQAHQDILTAALTPAAEGAS